MWPCPSIKTIVGSVGPGTATALGAAFVVVPERGDELLIGRNIAEVDALLTLGLAGVVPSQTLRCLASGCQSSIVLLAHR